MKAIRDELRPTYDPRETEGHLIRRPYLPPRLHVHGDLRDLTCGATGDNPESGGTFFNL